MMKKGVMEEEVREGKEALEETNERRKKGLVVLGRILWRGGVEVVVVLGRMWWHGIELVVVVLDCIWCRVGSGCNSTPN